MKMRFFVVESLTQAQKVAPWAAKIAKVTGGYMAFESLEDYKVWLKQK